MGKEENSYIIIDKNNKYDKGPLSRRGQKWTEAEDESLMREFSSGKSLVSIAKSHKRTKGGIITRLRKNGIEEEELLKFAENDEEQDIEEIWTKDGKLLDEDSMFADKKGTEEDDCSAYRFLTEEERLIYISNKWDKNRFVRAERKSIKDAFSKGVPLDEIALYHGRSVKKIIKKLKQFGVWQDNRKPVYKNMSKDDIETLFLKRKHISDKEGLEIWQEAYRGKKLEKISLEHGVSVECIIKKFVDMQVFSGIENNINIQANTQNKEEKKSNKQEIINKFKEGKSIDEIAEMLDLPREKIERKLERWGYLNYWEKQNEKSNEYENVWVEKNGKWHRVWTEKEEDELLDEYHRGKSIKAMASYHKRSDKAIILRLEKLGVLKGTEHIGIRRVKNNTKKKSLKRYATIAKDVKFNTEMWTEHEDSKLKEEFYLGLTFGEISDAHKRTMGEVVSRMVDLGLIK